MQTYAFFPRLKDKNTIKRREQTKDEGTKTGQTSDSLAACRYAAVTTDTRRTARTIPTP